MGMVVPRSVGTGHLAIALPSKEYTKRRETLQAFFGRIDVPRRFEAESVQHPGQLLT